MMEFVSRESPVNTIVGRRRQCITDAVGRTGLPLVGHSKAFCDPPRLSGSPSADVLKGLTECGSALRTRGHLGFVRRGATRYLHMRGKFALENLRRMAIQGGTAGTQDHSGASL
jgi:hypothetical protein